MRALIAVVALAAACTLDRSSRATLSDDDAGIPLVPERPVIVSIGGFNSCPAPAADGGVDPRTDATFGPATRALDTLTDGLAVRAAQSFARRAPTAAEREPHYVVTCYDKDGNLFISAAHALDVVKTTFSVLDPLVDAVVRESGDGLHPLVVLGHSHGGWTALQLAFRLPPHVLVEQLVTVDPISAIQCRPETYHGLLLGTDRGQFAGCRRAPDDVVPRMRRAILARLGRGGWHHYYQRSFAPLCSSAYDEDDARPTVSSDLSPLMSVLPRGVRPAANAHVAIVSLSVIDDARRAALEQYYLPTASLTPPPASPAAP